MLKKTLNSLGKKITSSSVRRGQSDGLKTQLYHYSAKRMDSNRSDGRNRTKDVEQLQKVEKESRTRSARTIKVVRKLGLVLLILLTLYASFLNGAVVIKNERQIEGNPSQIKSFAQKELNRSILNKLKPTLNEKQLEMSIKKEFLGISNVEASTSLFSSHVSLKITMSQPTLLLSNGNVVYIVGEDGVILEDLAKRKGYDTSKLPLVQDQSALDLAVGKQALTLNQVKYVTDVAFQSEQKGLNVETMILLPGGVELDVKYGGLKYYVKYNLFEDARQSSGTFLAIKDELDKKKTPPSDYIDVRIPERAYVK